MAGSVEGMSASADGLVLATTSNDGSLKIYDVVNFGAGGPVADGGGRRRKVGPAGR